MFKGKGCLRDGHYLSKPIRRHSFLPFQKLLIGPLIQEPFSSVWKTTIITPVFKSGEQMVISNYRPISILPAVSQIAEKLIFEQTISHLNTTSFSLHPMQFGFQKHHSTETENSFLLENVKFKLDMGGVVGAVFLDLKKAFDTVNHEVLITKLSKFNFSPYVIKWIKSYLNRKQCVRVDNKNSQIVDNYVVYLKVQLWVLC